MYEPVCPSAKQWGQALGSCAGLHVLGEYSPMLQEGVHSTANKIHSSRLRETAERREKLFPTF